MRRAIALLAAFCIVAFLGSCGTSGEDAASDGKGKQTDKAAPADAKKHESSAEPTVAQAEPSGSAEEQKSSAAPAPEKPGKKQAASKAKAAPETGTSPQTSTSPQTKSPPQAEVSPRTKASPLRAVRAAYRMTRTQTRSARVSLVTGIYGLPPEAKMGKNFRITAYGAVDLQKGAARLFMRMPRVQGMPTMGSFEVRQIGGTLYEKVPPQLRSRMPGGKPWIKMNLNEYYREQYGMGLSRMQNSASTDPTEQLSYLRSVSDSARRVGSDEIRGTPTSHYRAAIDLQKLSTAQNSQTLEPYKQLGLRRLPVEIWIDHQHRVRRMKMIMPFPKMQGSSGTNTGRMRMVLVEDLYSFGKPVHVVRPPANQTSDITNLGAGGVSSL